MSTTTIPSPNQEKNASYFQIVKELLAASQQRNPKQGILKILHKAQDALATILFSWNKESNTWQPDAQIFSNDSASAQKTLIQEIVHHLGSLNDIKQPVRFILKSGAEPSEVFLLPIPWNNSTQILTQIVPSPTKNEQRLLIQMLLPFFLYHQTEQLLKKNTIAFYQSTALLEIIQSVGSSADLREASDNLSEGFKKHLQCHTVSILTGKKVQAISGSSGFDPRTPKAQAIRSALLELRNEEEFHIISIKSPSFDSLWKKELEQHFPKQTFAYLPLNKNPDNTPLGAILFSWENKEPIPETTLNFIRASKTHLETQFANIYTNRPPRLVRYWKKITQKLSSFQRYFLFFAICAIAVTLKTPFTYQVKSEATLEPTVQREVLTPFSSTLKSVYIKPGDIVKKGQILAELDEKELQMKLTELTAAQDKASQQMLGALAQKDPAQAAIARLEMEKLAAQINLLNQRKSQLKIKAPIDGVVLSGDLKRYENIPLKIGDKLFHVAPLDAFKLLIAIPEGEVFYTQPGQALTVHLNAFPNSSWQTSIDHIRPSAQNVDHKNAFIAEAYLHDFNQPLLPGMKGKVSIESEPKSLFWALTHKAQNKFRNLFFW